MLRPTSLVLLVESMLRATRRWIEIRRAQQQCRPLTSRWSSSLTDSEQLVNTSSSCSSVAGDGEYQRSPLTSRWSSSLTDREQELTPRSTCSSLLVVLHVVAQCYTQKVSASSRVDAQSYTQMDRDTMELSTDATHVLCYSCQQLHTSCWSRCTHSSSSCILLFMCMH